MGGTFQATAKFQDSDFFQKAVKMVFRFILSIISGFRLSPSPAHVIVMWFALNVIPLFFNAVCTATRNYHLITQELA